MEKAFVLAIHIGLAITALFLGGVIAAMRKGTVRHRLLGRVWAVIMLAVAATSFAFPAERLLIVGGLSYLHILALATFLMLPLAVWAVRSGRTLLHRRLMLTLYALLCITGIAAMFMPGRFLHQLFLA